MENSVFHDAAQRGDADLVPVGNAALCSLFAPWLSDIAKQNPRSELAALCRQGTQNKDSCEADVARLLYQLIRLSKPKVVIEVGVFIGAASSHLAEALAHNEIEAELHLVDNVTNHLETARKNLESFGLTKGVYFVQGDSTALVESGRLPKADLVFIDGDHSFEGVRRDIASYWPLVRMNGLVLLHDSILFNGVRLNVNKLSKLLPENVFTIATSGGSGISIIQKTEDLPGGFR